MEYLRTKVDSQIRKTRLLYPVIIIILLTASSVAFLLLNNRAYTFKGSSFSPFPPAQNFNLEDQNGNSFQLNTNLGKVVLLYFGYTNCPDICPTTLANYAQISKRLADQTDQVVFVFITVDPERDTRERLQNYLPSFNAPIIGLTGNLGELEPVWNSYYVARELILATASAGETTHHSPVVDHASRIYVIDKTGRLRLTFPYGMNFYDMTDDILHLLREPDPNAN